MAKRSEPKRRAAGLCKKSLYTQSFQLFRVTLDWKRLKKCPVHYCVKTVCVLPEVCEVSLDVQVQDGGWSGGAQRRAVLAQ